MAESTAAPGAKPNSSRRSWKLKFAIGFPKPGEGHVMQAGRVHFRLAVGLLVRRILQGSGCIDCPHEGSAAYCGDLNNYLYCFGGSLL